MSFQLYVKYLLNVELNQYCDVLEVQELGKFVFKIFLQIMNVLETVLLHQLTLQQSFKKQKDQMMKRLNQKIKIEQKGQENKNLQEKDKQYYTKMEHKRFQVNQIQKQLNKIQTHSNQNQIINQNIQKSVQKALSIQSSNVEFIIQESCFLIQSKYNSLMDLMQIRKNKIDVQQPGNFKKISQQLFGNSRFQNFLGQKSQKTLNKLIEVVKKFISIRQSQKRQNSKSIQTQTQYKQTQDNTKSQKKRKQLQKLNKQQVQKLKQQLKCSKIKNNTLEKMLKENTQKLQDQLKKQRISVFKLEQQRISIASKAARQSEFTIDFVESEFNSNKGSIKPGGKFQDFDANSDIFSRKSLSRFEGSKKLLQKKMSGIQLGIQKQRQSRKSRKSGFIKSKVLMKIQNVIQFQLRPNKLTQVKSSQGTPILNDQISHVEVGSQTQTWRLNQGLKKKPKVQKFVKFKNQFQICHQFSFHLNPDQIKHQNYDDQGLTKPEQKSLQYKQIKISQNKSNIDGMNGFSNLLRKKKGVINWSKNINSRMINKNIYQINQVRQNPSNGCNTQLFSELSISCLGVDKIHKKQRQESKFYIKTNLSVLKALQLDLKDIEYLFLTIQKAKNYQYLNYHISSQKLDNSLLAKSKRFMSLHKSSQNYKDQSKNNARSRSYTSENNKRIYHINNELLVSQIIRHLKRIKHLNPDKYEIIRNFLRFPFSSITKCNQQKWTYFSKEEEQINIQQAKVLFNRIQKLHSRCQRDQNLHFCEHIIFFLSKIGIFIYKT